MEFRKLINTLKFSYKFNEDLPKKFIELVFIQSDGATEILVDTIRQSVDNPPEIEITKNTKLEVSIAIIGVSIALMISGRSGFVTASQGKKIEKICRETIKKDFGYSSKENNLINEKLDEYIEAYNKSWSQKTNPFNAPAGILILEILGEKNIHIAMGPDGNLSYLTHQMVMDQLMLMMIEPNKIWKL